MSKRTTRSTGKASPLMVRLDAESKRALAATAELWRISVSNYVRTETVAQAHRDARPEVKGVAFPQGFQLQPLRRSHARRDFQSSQAQVTDWLRTQALQHQEKLLSVTKVLLDGTGAVAGVYTLATGQVDFGDLPSDLMRKLPRRALPVANIAWLGVNQAHQGRNPGDLLFAQALRVCPDAGQTSALVAVILDCVDDRAKAFQERWDFAELPDYPYRLYLSSQVQAAMIPPGQSGTPLISLPLPSP